MRVSCRALLALIGLAALAAAQLVDAPGGAVPPAVPASPFLNPDSRAAQFGYERANAGQFCLARDVSLGDATTFEAWLLPTKANGGIITAVNLGGEPATAAGRPQVSFRLVNWRLQVFIQGTPYTGGELSTMKVDSNNMIWPLRWTRVFGTVQPNLDRQTTTACVMFERWESRTGGNGELQTTCVTSNIAFPLQSFTHLYVGDDSALSTVGNYRGLIESLRVWRVAFTPREAAALTAIPAADPRLAAAWTFDECQQILGCIPSVSDTSGGNPAIVLSCGSANCALSPVCVRTSALVSQVGGFEPFPVEPVPMGSGRIATPPDTRPPAQIVTTPPPTTPAPPPPPPPDPPMDNGGGGGDPHFTTVLPDGTETSFDFNGFGWHWVVPAANNIKGVQLNYVECGGPWTCIGGIAWRNGRETGWWLAGQRSVTIMNDNTRVAWNPSGVVTPAGTIVSIARRRPEDALPSISITIPGALSTSGLISDHWGFLTSWEFKVESAYPQSGKQFVVPVAEVDLYYRGNDLPVRCEDCDAPKAAEPVLCPASADADCKLDKNAKCKWDEETCPCIAAVCYNEALVSAADRLGCLEDAAQGLSMAPAMLSTWRACERRLVRFYATAVPALVPNDPRLAQFPCAAGAHCPNFCNGPCHGTCNADLTCSCKEGWTGVDCGQRVSPDRRRQAATAGDISGVIESFASAGSFYAYSPSDATATADNHVQARGLAAFFLYTQLPPPFPVATPDALPLHADAVTSFGVTVRGQEAPASLEIEVKIYDRSSGSPITTADVQLRDDADDQYKWTAASGAGSFRWNVDPAKTDGTLVGPLPSPVNAFCAEVTVTGFAGIERFAVMTGDPANTAVPRMHVLNVAAGSTFRVCSQAPYDACVSYTDCGSCNARPECGWCDSANQCMTGGPAGPAAGTCTTWRSETDPHVSRVVEQRTDPEAAVRVSQVRAYLAPDNAAVTVPVWVALPPTAASFAYQVRGLFEFTDRMAPFYAKFLAASGGAALSGAVQRVSPGSTLATASFRDKAHVQPHGRAGDWIYREHTGFARASLSAETLQADFAAWPSSPNLVSDFDPALGVGTLEALLHEAHHGWPINPADKTKNVALVFVKSAAAQAGIAVTAADSTSVKLGVPLRPNDGDTTADDYEDYPTEAQVARALIARGIIPVFVVPDAAPADAVAASYRALVQRWGFGKVWPDVNGRNALTSDMSAEAGTAVLAAILADLASTVQIVATDPEVRTTLASPVLASASDLPLGAVVSLPVTLQRTTGAAGKRDADSELFRLFYKDRRMVSVMGVGQFEVVAATTDAPSAEDVDFTITAGEASTVAHVLTIASYSIYDQDLTTYIVSQPGAGVVLYDIASGTVPEVKGAAIGATGRVNDILRRVYIDVPAATVGSESAGFVVTSFTYKTVDSCGLESREATVTVRVVPKGVHAPRRYEPPTADFKATVNENTVSHPTRTLVCVGGIDYDATSVIRTKLVSVPEHGTLYHILDSRGSIGAQAKAGDVVNSAMGAMAAPAVACFVYVPPLRDAVNAAPYGPAYGSFTWQLIDNTGLVSAIERTAIDVRPVNYPPVALDASVSGWENRPLLVDLAAYDDPRADGVNGGAVSLLVSATPKHGRLLNKDGSAIVSTVVLSGSVITVQYVPDQNTHSAINPDGSLALFDFFTYVVTDAGGLSAAATVRLYVRSSTRMPQLAFEAGGEAWTYPMLSATDGKAHKVCLTVSNVENPAETGVYVTALPSQGVVSTSKGAHKATPVAAERSASGAYCFTYKAKSGGAGTDQISVAVCDACGPATGANFNALLAAAPASTLVVNLPPKSRAASGLSGGATAGIALAAIAAAAVVLVVMFFAYKARRPTPVADAPAAEAKAPLL